LHAAEIKQINPGQNMKHNSKFLLTLVILVTGIIGLTTYNASAKAQDSLRVGMVIKDINALTVTVQDSILPNLQGDDKKKIKEMNSKLKEMMKKSEDQFKDTAQTDFKKLSSKEMTSLTAMEKQISDLKSALPQQSKGYHLVALAHLPVYKAVQEMRKDGRTPLLSTYKEPYNPNTTTNNQVTMVGAYMNFYLEYRITVGGIVMGPDIVDPDRLVFTFPNKLLESMTEPTYVEVIASPRKQMIVDGYEKIVEGGEQHSFVLVYPVKK
jgi:hypothetical protein